MRKQAKAESSATDAERFHEEYVADTGGTSGVQELFDPIGTATMVSGLPVNDFSKGVLPPV